MNRSYSVSINDEKYCMDGEIYSHYRAEVCWSWSDEERKWHSDNVYLYATNLKQLGEEIGEAVSILLERDETEAVSKGFNQWDSVT